MPKTDRLRVDYMPCQAAIEALQAAQAHYPKDSTQALIDRLVITGLSAVMRGRWEPPHLWGQRDRWQLPVNLREQPPGVPDER